MTDKQVFHSEPYEGRWRVSKAGTTVATCSTQTEADIEAIQAARSVQAKGGYAQVIFIKQDGSIREDRNYGADPQR